MPAAVACAALLQLGGCATTGQRLVVDAVTDLSPGVEFHGIAVELLRGDDAIDERDLAAERADEAWLEGKRVATLTDIASGTYALKATLFRSGQPILVRRVQVLIDGDRAVRLLMSRSCAGIECPQAGDSPAAVACLGGRCVLPECIDGTQPQCSAAQCASDSDCAGASQVDCQQANCEQGICLLAVNDDVCDEGQVCHPEQGCVPRSRCNGAEECNDQDLCTEDQCDRFRICAYDAVAPGTPCGGGACREDGICAVCAVDGDCPDGVCNPVSGQCVECLAASDCLVDSCNSARCDAGSCVVANAIDGQACPGGVCRRGVCIACSEDIDCDDGNACTVDQCDSDGCSSTNLPDLSACAAGFCVDGLCQGCTSDVLCDPGTPRCDLAQQTCVECLAPDDCPSAECMEAGCVAQQCESQPLPDGSNCTGGTCRVGVCEAARCDDGLRNGTEAGVDCGGTCPASCGLCDLQTEIPVPECNALLEFYRSAGGRFSRVLQDWGRSAVPCNWRGVVCRDGHVEELTISSAGLFGTISPALGDLTQLQVLDLRYNGGLGGFPVELTTLSRLRYLGLSFNNIRQPLPLRLAH